MVWIKRNLALVIGLAVSLGLLAGAIVYLIGNYDEDFNRDEDLGKLKVRLDALQASVAPTEANIQIVRSNVTQVTQFTTEVERLLAQEPAKLPQGLSLGVYLPRVIDEMRRDATNAAVELPPKYEFTFGEIKAMPRVPAYAVEPVSVRLGEVRSLCNVLFKARVRSLESLQRVAAFADEPKGVDLIQDRVEQTNTLSTNITVITTPYRLVFRGFSADLSAVLNGLSATKEFFVVRQVDVEPAAGGPATPGPMDGMMTPMAPNPFGGLGAPGGLGMAPGVGAPGVAAPGVATPGAPAQPRPPTGKASAPAAPKSALTKVLDERPLRITLVVDVIKTVAQRAAPAAPSAANK